MAETISVDKLVAAYIKMRNKRAELLRAYEGADSEVKMQMELVESRLLELCKEIGADTLGSKHGKVIRTVKTRYWTNDWDSMYRFINEHRMPELLERRISQSTIKQLLEENPELVPPGINTESRYAVVIRRSSGT